MNQAFRTTQRLMVSALLLSAVAMAQTGANNTDNTKSTEHHSKLSKAAFWRHHDDAHKAATSNQSQPKTAQIKPAAANPSQAGKAQVKPVAAKQPASKNGQKQNSAKTASPLAKKTTANAKSAAAKKSPQKSVTAPNTQGSQKESPKQ